MEPVRAGPWRALAVLTPYIWPSDRPDLKRTVVISLLLMVAAKLVTIVMPFTFKWATDALVAATGGRQPEAVAWGWLVGAPIAATIAYGVVRVAIALLSQAREGLFAKVAM